MKHWHIEIVIGTLRYFRLQTQKQPFWILVSTRMKDPREVYSRRAPAFLSKSSFLSVHTGLTEGPLVKGNYSQTKVNRTPQDHINELII